jgi:hypothetical protein
MAVGASSYVWNIIQFQLGLMGSIVLSAHSVKIEKGKERREEEEEIRREGQSTFEGCSEPIAS